MVVTLPSNSLDVITGVIIPFSSAVIVISANYSTNYHEVDLILKNCKVNGSEAINALKSKLEVKLETKLKSITYPISKLISDIKEN